MTPGRPPTADLRFDERRAVSWWWWPVTLAIVVPTAEATLVLGPQMSGHGGWLLASGTGVGSAAVVAVLLWALSRSRVVVDADGLRVDGMLLPASAIGRVRRLDREAARLVLGVRARADAVLSLRPWLSEAVQIEVVDPADPVPYWVVATRRADRLRSCLEELRRETAVAAGESPSGAVAGESPSGRIG